MDTDQQQESADSKQDVYRLKKVSILGLATGIIVPWILCVILILYSVNLSASCDALRITVQQLEERLQTEQTKTQELADRSASLLEAEQDGTKQLSMRLTEMENTVSDLQAELSHYQNQPTEHKVYLTFDDGPSSNTDRILDILKEYDVKATFFVLGKEDEKSKARLKRIVEEGHSLGMHSYTHRYDDIYASREAFASDVTKLQDYLEEVTGVKSMLYRFPGGSSNTVTDVDIHEFIDYLNEQGIVYFDWNIASGDAAKISLTPEKIWKNSVEGITKRSTSVILFHDAASRDTTVDALPMIIEFIQALDNTEILPLTVDSVPVQHVKSRVSEEQPEEVAESAEADTSDETGDSDEENPEETGESDRKKASGETEESESQKAEKSADQGATQESGAGDSLEAVEETEEDDQQENAQ